MRDNLGIAFSTSDPSRRSPRATAVGLMGRHDPMAPKVLIVEDNDATRSGLSELLRRAGFDTYATPSFEEGQRAMREDGPDLLLADIRLGPYNGLQLLVTSPRRVPTIIMTGYP